VILIRDSPDSSEQGTITLLLEHIDGLVGQSAATALEAVVPRIEVNEAELQVQGGGKGFKDPSTGLDKVMLATTIVLPVRQNADIPG
jgi:hypothetical protein